MSTRRRNATIGETSDGTPEFGEIYHAIVGSQLKSDFYPDFIRFDSGKKFYEQMIGERDEKETQNYHQGETANWISDDYHEGVQTALWEKISALANDQKKGQTEKQDSWSRKLPEHLRRYLTADPKVLIWLRSKAYKSHRNSSLESVRQLVTLCQEMGALPVFVGKEIKGLPSDPVNLGEFYRHPWFRDDHNIARQLWFLNKLYEEGGVLASVGMMSGAMDGLSMICGKKVVFLAKKEDACPRMMKITNAVPALHWVELFYSGNFKNLSKHELKSIRRCIWP